MKMHQDKFNFMHKSNQRIMNEDFISYDIYLYFLFYCILFILISWNKCSVLWRKKIESIINSTSNTIIQIVQMIITKVYLL